MKLKNKVKSSGMSLIEILIVVGIFSILGILTTRAIILTIGGGKKTENLIKVRENLNYALGVIERQLRNADGISDCTNTNTLRIDYMDQNGRSASFSCANLGSGTVGYVASGSARLTVDAIDITACTFRCINGNPPSVKINMEAKNTSISGTENSTVQASSEVYLRSY
jgi:prepilin-type N-terminal cleavage/methylation domain-containing protein